MTKESLREKFWKDCKDKKLEPMSECEQIDMMWDFFWNEMQKEREGLWDKIVKLPCHSHGGKTPDGKIPSAILVSDLLALIKQDEN